MKYRLREERDGSRWPALTAAFYVELPTGDPDRQLGSGRADYWLNMVAQKAITDRLTYRVNLGILFSGNTLTGAVGIAATRGQVFTGSSSITYQAKRRLLIGCEVAGAFTDQFALGKAQLQGLFGGKFALSKAVALDFALTGGKFEGSPKIGFAFGIAFDF